MLPRVLESEVMDSPGEAHDYDAMDHATVNRVFVEDLLAFWPGPGTVLDVGTGTAQIPIELCRQAERIHVTGIDLAKHMLAVGEQNVARAGHQERIHLQHVDAKGIPWPAESFDAVISNSIVHHIPQPVVVLAEMVRVLRPVGVIFVRDLLRPDSDAAVSRLVQLHAAGANQHQQKMFDDSLRAALTLDEVRALVSGLGYDPTHVKQTSDRHWTWATRTPLAA